MAKAASENLTGNLPLNCVLIHRDGHEVFIEDSVAPIHDREGAVTGAVIVFRDVSVARAQSEQMTHLAEHDSLTGLPNRLLFCDRVGQAISLARDTGGGPPCCSWIWMASNSINDPGTRRSVHRHGSEPSPPGHCSGS
jgi:hypothetical protein